MSFHVDLAGRLQNIDLKPSKVLNPLFEAISNSIHAIDDAGGTTGTISVEILRSNIGTLLDDEAKEIEGFRVRDSGVGFDEPNFNSFQRSDSRYKQSRGGKGVGRLLWLKAFRYVRVSSVFAESGRLMRRSFIFSVPDGVQGGEVEEWPTGPIGTDLMLADMLPEFRERCPTSAQVIAKRIVEHFALVFLGRAPNVEIDGSERYRLNDVRDALFLHGGPDTEFKVGGQDFCLHHFHNHGSPERRDHVICLCVDGRAVKTESLRSVLPAVPARKIADSDTGESFYYMGMVTGEALDRSMNPERTDFSLDDDEPGLPGILTSSDLLKAIGASVNSYLAPHLKPAREESRRTIERFVRGKAPQYLPIIRDPEALRDLPADLTDETKIDQYLRRIQFRKEMELSERAKVLQDKKPVSAQDFESYKEDVLRFFEEENDYGKSALARYVIHRKVVIELLEKMLGQDDSGEFPLEEVIHKIICPMRITSDDKEYEQHNLWLVDERLAFHRFLASDSTYREQGTGDKQSPDVMIFDVGLAFADDDPPRSVVMLEFKRPQRDNYTSGKKKNPMDQVLEYVASLREQEWVDPKKRTVRINEATQFYCYLICDLMPTLEREAKKRGWTPTPDGEGYYSYNPNFKVYLELISYKKLLRDSRMRNRILFTSLGLE